MRCKHPKTRIYRLSWKSGEERFLKKCFNCLRIVGETLKEDYMLQQKEFMSKSLVQSQKA
jgi:hypothetical protein